MAVRIVGVALLNRRVYEIAARGWPLTAPAYEMLAASLLFGVGLFRRTVVWRGRRYRLGPHGTIAGVINANVIDANVIDANVGDLPRV